MTSALDALVFLKVRQGATGPGRRLRATPVQDNARVHEPNVEFTYFNW